MSEPLPVEEIPAALAGERLDRVVAMVAELSRAAAHELIASGGVQVDGRVETSPKRRLRAGQRLRVERPPPPEDDAPAPDPTVSVPVVHADDAVIVVDKPAGLVVHPGAGHRGGTLVSGLLARYPELAGVGERHRPGIVHRLDGGTSGLLVVARTPAAYQSLVGQLRRREVTRRYLALVWGVPEARQGLIDAPLGRSERDPTRIAVTSQGRDARTRYHVEAAYRTPSPVALLRCELETGRTHQIRVHLAAIGHPVVGDDRYGGRRPSIAVARPFLHAAELAFVHPVSGERMRFEAPLPEDLAAVLATLGDEDAASD